MTFPFYPAKPQTQVSPRQSIWHGSGAVILPHHQVLLLALQW